MSDAVILEDGFVVYLDNISETEIFDPNNTEVIFKLNGRVRRFKSNRFTNGRYYMAVYDNPSGEFAGYYPEYDFWRRESIIKGENLYTKPVFGSFHTTQWGPAVIRHLQDIDEDTRVILVRKYLDIEVTSLPFAIVNYLIKVEVKGFSFKAYASQYPSALGEFKVTNNKILLNDKPLSFADVNSSFMGYQEPPIVTSSIDSILESYYSELLMRGYLGNQYDFRMEIVLDVIYLFQQLIFENGALHSYLEDNDLMLPFTKHFQLVSNNILLVGYEDYYIAEYFALLRIRLIEFKLWVEAIAFKPASMFESAFYAPNNIDFLVRVVSLFGRLELSFLAYDVKVNFLEEMLEGNYWLSGRWNPFYNGQLLTEEEVIIRIIDSIKRADNSGNLYFNEINDFLVLLNNRPSFLHDSKETLYQFLYERIQDDILFGDDGNGSKGKFVKAVYGLWSLSKYNLSNDLIPESERVMSDYKSKSNHAMWKYEDPIESDEIDFDAKPFLINYESDKILLWYNDNFEFPFYENKIMAAKEVWQNGYEMVLTSMIRSTLLSTPLDYTKYVPFGFYDIFDPVSILQTNSDDTIIKIPLNVASIANPCAVDGENNSNEIPIFYLKYVNDLASYSNFNETIGVMVDVALTFTGVGNIAKLRYLNKVSTMRRALIGKMVIQGAEKVAIKRSIRHLVRQGAFATWEIVLGTAGILHSMITSSCQGSDPCNPPALPQPSDPNYVQLLAEYEQHQDCQAIQNWLLALELFTLSGDLLAKRYFKKRSIKLRQRITANKINNHNDPLIDNAIKGDANRFLDEISNIDNMVGDLLADYPNVRDKVDLFGIDEDKINFISDFNGKSNTLTELNSNIDAIDNWLILSGAKVPLVERTSINIISDNILSTNYNRYYSNGSLTDVLSSLDFDSRLKYMLSQYGNLPTLPTPNFIRVWQKLDTVGESGEFFIGNKQIIENLEGFIDDYDVFGNNLLETFLHEGNHANRGTAFKEFISESPEDISNIVKPILKNPAYSFSNKELLDPRWTKWRKTHFCKYWFTTGKKFETLVNTGLAKRGSPIYMNFQERLDSLDISKNLDEYEFFTGVQLKYNDAGDYFIADQLFIKYEYDPLLGENYISDIIIVETKLRDNVNLSFHQGEALMAAYGNLFKGYKVRNVGKVKKGHYSNSYFLNNELEFGLRFNGTPTFLKVKDTETGKVITGLENLIPPL